MSKKTQLSDETPLSREEFYKLQREKKIKEQFSRHESETTKERKI